jgi:hypothetical protein
MPRSSSPRKAYKPRPINAPITAGLVDMFQECLMTAETGLHLRAPTTDHYDAIAACLNVIGPVALRRFGSKHADAIAIQSAALAMNAAADRAAAGNGRMYDHELAAVTRGIEAAKGALPYLDVRSLYEQHRLVQRRVAVEGSA